MIVQLNNEKQQIEQEKENLKELHDYEIQQLSDERDSILFKFNELEATHKKCLIADFGELRREIEILKDQLKQAQLSESHTMSLANGKITEAN